MNDHVNKIVSQFNHHHHHIHKKALLLLGPSERGHRMTSALPKSISSAAAVLFRNPLLTAGRRGRGRPFSLSTTGARSTPHPCSVRASFSFSDARVPDFLSSDWLETRKKKPFGPRLEFTAEEAVRWQLDALKYNDRPCQDYGLEVMYRFAGFDPFERSTYFGPFFDLGQFERFRRIFNHSNYRVLLGHKETKILSSLFVDETRYKQRLWVQGCRPEEEEIFEFTMVQRIGGLCDGYWLTESLLHDGDGVSRGIAY